MKNEDYRIEATTCLVTPRWQTWRFNASATSDEESASAARCHEWQEAAS
jgi:hypothetical protein